MVCVCVAVPRSEGKTPLAAYSDILVVASCCSSSATIGPRDEPFHPKGRIGRPTGHGDTGSFCGS